MLFLTVCLFLFSGIVEANTTFKLKAEGIIIDFDRFFITALPGKSISVDVKGTADENIDVKTDFEAKPYFESGVWKIKAPAKSGNYEIDFIDKNSGEKITLVLFVLMPYSQMEGEYLNGYRIGHYPERIYKGKSNYHRPEGFIEVTERNKDLYISPHFQLKQFLCKQKSGWPKYIVLNPRLLIKFERIVSDLNKDGYAVKTLFIMSGYRTPYYNKSIGNVKFSRHVYGDAADVYVDDNGDGVIDDLNRDGKSDIEDARIIAKAAELLDDDSEYGTLKGGIGTYKKNSRHTYFVHIDTRGYKARW